MFSVMKPQRREFLRSLAAGAAALALPRATFGQANLTSTKLTDTVTLISGAGNNVIVLAGSGGSLLVDCGDAAQAQALLKIVGRVNTVINTHWHLESTGANDAMAKAGAKLVSHVNTQLWMTQEIIHDWEKKISRRAPRKLCPRRRSTQRANYPPGQNRSNTVSCKWRTRMAISTCISHYRTF